MIPDIAFFHLATGSHDKNWGEVLYIKIFSMTVVYSRYGFGPMGITPPTF